MHVLIFCELSVKTPFTPLKFGFWGKIGDGAILTSNELVVTFGGCYLCGAHKIGLKIPRIVAALQFLFFFKGVGSIWALDTSGF